MAMNEAMWQSLAERIVSDYEETVEGAEWRWNYRRTPVRGIVISTQFGSRAYVEPLHGELDGYLNVDVQHEDPQPGDVTMMVIYGSACADETEGAWPFHCAAISESIVDQLR